MIGINIVHLLTINVNEKKWFFFETLPRIRGRVGRLAYHTLYDQQ